MTDTSTSAPPTMLTREQVTDFLRPEISVFVDNMRVQMPVNGTRWQRLATSHLAALDRIEAQETEIGRLRGALRFYADPDNYDAAGAPGVRTNHSSGIGHDWVDDHGDRARAALAAVADTQEEAGDA